MTLPKHLIRQAVVAAVRPFGFELRRHNEYIGYIPDRFSENREKYSQIGTAFSGRSVAAFLAGNTRNTGDLTRYYFLAMVCDLVEKEAIPGDVAELGVYKGNTAFLLADLARRIGCTAYLFDTFKGLPERDIIGIDSIYHDRKCDFMDTSIEAVRDLVGSSNVELIAGYFPDSITNASAKTRYALVHLDCDLYAPTRAGLEFFYPKLVRGGFLIVHDYMSLYWDGIEKAVNEFFADKPERFIPIPDKSGTIAIRKH
jgi:O-methyltransferase